VAGAEAFLIAPSKEKTLPECSTYRPRVVIDNFSVREHSLYIWLRVENQLQSAQLFRIPDIVLIGEGN
jgi:hypothetical protein